MKQYNLEIENIGEDTYMLISKGHHDKDVFMKEVFNSYNWPLGNPQHIWMRTVPTRNLNYAYLFVEAKPNSRGAFPVTFVREAYGEDQYVRE